MLADGAGLFRVDQERRSKSEQKQLDRHPWAPRLKRYLHEAAEYGADWVYFRLEALSGGPRPEIFVFDESEILADGTQGDALGRLHVQLWNYGAVPFAYFLRPTGVDIFNLMRPPEFDEQGVIEPQLLDQLALPPAEAIAAAGAALSGIKKKEAARWARFSSEHFDNGGFWEMAANRDLGVADHGALDSLVKDMRTVRRVLISQLTGLQDEDQRDLLVRRLLIVILMIQFLRERGIIPPGYFSSGKLSEASGFLDVLGQPKLLIKALDQLKDDFNGDVFHIDDTIREIIRDLTADDLLPFVNFADPQSDGSQLHFWQRYSFRHLPVEVISYVYEEFLGGKSQSYFTPHHLVDLLLDESMPPSRTLRAFETGAKTRPKFRVLDPACGSGVFLVGAWKRLLETHLDAGGNSTPSALKRLMIDNIHGGDLREESVELSIFSLSVALCSSFKPKPGQPNYLFEKLRELKFPTLRNQNVREGDFFDVRSDLLNEGLSFDLVVGNPPFESALESESQQKLNSSPEDEDGKQWPEVPDQQLAYLFLRGVMPLVEPGGHACIIQPAGFLYNEKPLEFRSALFNNWHVPEILDFVSLSKLFKARKAAGNSVSVKTVAVLIQKVEPTFEKPLLHATFRRVSLLDQRKFFEIDPQDLHWTNWRDACEEPRVWKANLLGGGRLLETYRQLTSSGTLENHIDHLVETRDWICQEGFTEGKTPKEDHPEALAVPYLNTDGLTSSGLDPKSIEPNKIVKFHRPISMELFTPPHVLLKEHPSLPLAIRKSGSPLMFRDQIVGISAPKRDIGLLETVYVFLSENRENSEFFAAFGSKFLVGKHTALLKKSLMDRVCRWLNVFKFVLFQKCA